ncbi:MAG: twin-arginine translocase subunit TatC [Flavobacteriales bacterium]|nr:twin-arginine translocase subunit TatC [Flavobacteriales bacterium]MCB9167405.1 twin-arginine translocase subunit TatC [Flavobacteriales bacterium]
MAAEAGHKEMTFLEHLEELRWTLVRSAIAVVIGMVAAFIGKEFVFDKVVLAARSPDFITYRVLCWVSRQLGLGDGLCIKDLGFDLQNITMSGQFITHLMVSFVAGLIIASPYVFWEIWRFIAPGLHARERRMGGYAVGFASLLFLAGAAFGYYVMAPMSIQFLGGYQVSASVRNMISLDSYISTVTSIPLWSGLVFELPLIVFMLARMGLVGPDMLRSYRRHAYVGILVIAAIITPPDVSSQVLVSLPLIALYEAGIMLAAREERRYQRRNGEVRGQHGPERS